MLVEDHEGGTMGYVEPTQPGKLTLADLDALPDDGKRRELVNGRLVVPPSPLAVHQRAVSHLHLLLVPACPEDLEVFVAPFDFRPNNRSSLQPDVMVCRGDDVERNGVRRPPLLAVEVLSPSSRATDLITKRHVYEQAGVASYWVFDPEEAVFTVLELADGRYVEQTFKDDAVFDTDRPFPVRIVPADLVRRVNRSAR
jgi:Uma2 family endonuclease